MVRSARRSKRMPESERKLEQVAMSLNSGSRDVTGRVVLICGAISVV